MRVLFASMPAQSHIAPMLPLACATHRAGHDVVFATGPDAVAQVQGAGLEALPAGLRFAEVRRRYAQASGSELAGLSPQERLAHLLLHGLIRIAAPAMAAELLPFAGTWQPEVVIGNPGEWASEVVATAVGVPHVIHGFSSPKSNEMAAVLREGLAEVYQGLGIDPPRRAILTSAHSRIPGLPAARGFTDAFAMAAIAAILTIAAVLLTPARTADPAVTSSGLELASAYTPREQHT